MFASHLEQPRQSKRSMVAALDAPPVSAKLAARNTLDYTTASGIRVIRLHQTDILRISPNGLVKIETGGWNTTITRARLNDFLPKPWRVFTHKGQAHISPGYGPGAAAPVPFLNTVTIHPDGRITSDMKSGADTRLRKLIDSYMAEFKKKGLPADGAGDPWVLGDPKVSREVMMDWLKSKYVFRLMYVLAERYAGNQDTGIAYYLRQIDRDGGKLDAMHTRRIRRFIRACIGLEA